MMSQRRMTVKIKRGAHRFGNAAHRHVFTIKFAVDVVEVMHANLPDLLKILMFLYREPSVEKISLVRSTSCLCSERTSKPMKNHAGCVSRTYFGA
jgi:hypothetical protein